MQLPASKRVPALHIPGYPLQLLLVGCVDPGTSLGAYAFLLCPADIDHVADDAQVALLAVFLLEEALPHGL